MAVTYADYGSQGPLAFPTPDGTAAAPGYAQTFDRRLVNNITFQPATGVMHMTAIWLPGDATVSGITFVSGGTAESGGSHLWYALYRRTPAGVVTLMAQTADQTGAAALGANTALRVALTARQRLTYSGLYYLAFCAVATTMPAMYNITNTGINGNGNIAGMTPITSATADAALTDTAPATAGTFTTITQSLYAFVD